MNIIIKSKENINKLNKNTIPIELQKKNNWIFWKAVLVEIPRKRIAKIPLFYENGFHEFTKENRKWISFEEAFDIYTHFSTDVNLGYYIRQEEDIGFLDLDFVPQSFFADILHLSFLTYIEKSYSNKGFHILFKKPLIEKSKSVLDFEGLGKISMFCKNHTIAFTGNVLSTLKLGECQELVQKNNFFKKIFKKFYID